LRSRRPDEAIVELQHVLRSDPNNTEALRDLAWVLATWPDARIRDGPKAVELAERANKLDQGRDPFISITLAAAYAEAGRFSDAINTAEAALQAANYSGNATSAERIRAYLGLYRLGQAFRDVR
jgi:tetratricopeptide (TPR) repeat protein